MAELLIPEPRAGSAQQLIPSKEEKTTTSPTPGKTFRHRKTSSSDVTRWFWFADASQGRTSCSMKELSLVLLCLLRISRKGEFRACYQPLSDHSFPSHPSPSARELPAMTNSPRIAFSITLLRSILKFQVHVTTLRKLRLSNCQRDHQFVGVFAFFCFPNLSRKFISLFPSFVQWMQHFHHCSASYSLGVTMQQYFPVPLSTSSHYFKYMFKFH